MLAYLVIIKDVFTFIAPLLLMEWAARSAYRHSLLDVSIWWFKNYTNVDSAVIWATVIAFLFSFFAVWAALGHMTQSIYLKFFGETHKLIYIGNHEAGKGSFIQGTDEGGERIVTAYFKDGYNHSLSPIYTVSVFQREKGTDRIGSPVEAYQLTQFLQSLSLLLIFGIVLLGVLHTLMHPLLANGELGVTPEMTAVESFNHIFKEIGFSVANLTVAGFGGAFLIFFVGIFNTEYDYGKRVRELPVAYSAGEEIEGTPIRQVIRKSQSRTQAGGTNEIDTGYRYVVCKFEKGLDYAIYVTYQYHRDDHPGLEENIAAKIAVGQSMMFWIDKDLLLRLP